MAENTRKGDNQKLKMLYLVRIFTEETDEQHKLTMQQIIEKLGAKGVNADRKTLYKDLAELKEFGLDIISEQEGRNHYYYQGSRLFELPELKLLVDAVQSAKFITDRKSGELIKKLGSLASRYEASQLSRQVTISGRVKTMNESIYYNVDKLHEAINKGIQITFKYTDWNLDKQMVPRYEGMTYRTSPWGLVWDDEYYYLIGYNSTFGDIVHYRVDKMLRITVTDKPREGHEAFEKFNLPRYTKSLFGMFGGEETRVTIEAPNNKVGIFIDRFGKDIVIIPVGDDKFQTVVTVTLSTQFFGWIMAIGEGVRIVGPDEAVRRMKAEVKRLVDQYEIHA